MVICSEKLLAQLKILLGGLDPNFPTTEMDELIDAY